MWRVPNERVVLDLDGPSVEVAPIRSWAIQFEALALASVFQRASSPEEEYPALKTAYEYFIAEGQPQWDIVDHRGAVPVTARGMLRLPDALASEIVNQWLATFEAKAEHPEIEGLHVVESDAPSAVDALIPPGPLQTAVKRRLRRAKAA